MGFQELFDLDRITAFDRLLWSDGILQGDTIIGKRSDSDGALYVEVDGRQLYAFQLKYTLLELGYVLYLFVGDPDEEWLKENGETIPADPTDWRSAMESTGWLITSDPILFTLAYEHWWAQNGRPKPENVLLPIPLFDEALEIMRTREIINDFNAHRAGILPSHRNFAESPSRRKQQP